MDHKSQEQRFRFEHQVASFGPVTQQHQTPQHGTASMRVSVKGAALDTSRGATRASAVR